MGLILDKIAFEYPAPRAEVIASAASRQCGLQVCVEYAEPDQFRDYSANLYFDGFPEHVVKVHTYHQGAIREYEQEAYLASGFRSPIRCQGFDDADGIQRIYIQSYLESENTLIEVLIHATRNLEGCLDGVESDEVDGLVNLNSAIMTKRHNEFRKAQKKRMPWYIAYGLLMLITSPFWILWMLIKLPFELLQLRRKNPELFTK